MTQKTAAAAICRKWIKVNFNPDSASILPQRRIIERNMFKTLSILTLSAALCAGLAASAHADDGQLLSTMVGAGLGGWAGSNIGHGAGRLAATGAGVFIGGAIGHELGRPSYGAGYAQPAYYGDAYPYDMFPRTYYVPYQPTYVAPPDPPAPPPATYIDSDYGSYCREYSQLVRIGNRMRESYGTACLQPDGSWHIVE